MVRYGMVGLRQRSDWTALEDRGGCRGGCDAEEEDGHIYIFIAERHFTDTCVSQIYIHICISQILTDAKICDLMYPLTDLGDDER